MLPDRYQVNKHIIDESIGECKYGDTLTGRWVVVAGESAFGIDDEREMRGFFLVGDE